MKTLEFTTEWTHGTTFPPKIFYLNPRPDGTASITSLPPNERPPRLAVPIPFGADPEELDDWLMNNRDIIEGVAAGVVRPEECASRLADCLSVRHELDSDADCWAAVGKDWAASECPGTLLDYIRNRADAEDVDGFIVTTEVFSDGKRLYFWTPHEAIARLEERLRETPVVTRRGKAYGKRWSLWHRAREWSVVPSGVIPARWFPSIASAAAAVGVPASIFYRRAGRSRG